MGKLSNLGHGLLIDCDDISAVIYPSGKDKLIIMLKNGETINVTQHAEDMLHNLQVHVYGQADM